MAFEVPPLPYDYAALEPTIDEATMKLHHDKHHQAYVDNANKALDGTDLADAPVEEVLAKLSTLPADKQGPVRNNAGGHANHTLFWESMSADGGGRPDRRARRGDRRRVRLVRRLQDPVRGQRRRPVRLRLDVARPRRRRAEAHQDAQPGQPAARRPDPAARQRRLGARVLPDVQQPPPRVPQDVVERRRLGRRRRAVRRSEVDPPALRFRRAQARWKRRLVVGDCSSVSWLAACSMAAMRSGVRSPALSASICASSAAPSRPAPRRRRPFLPAA